MRPPVPADPAQGVEEAQRLAGVPQEARAELRELPHRVQVLRALLDESRQRLRLARNRWGRARHARKSVFHRTPSSWRHCLVSR